MEELLALALRVSLMYFYGLLVVRLAGKRALKNLTALDFITSFIIADLFDGMIFGDQPVVAGLVAVGSIVLLHILVSLVTMCNAPLRRLLLNDQKVALVQSGRTQRKNLARQRLNEDELAGLLRLQGLDMETEKAEIKLAALESNGMLSVIQTESAKPAQKKDLEALRKRLR